MATIPKRTPIPLRKPIFCFSSNAPKNNRHGNNQTIGDRINYEARLRTDAAYHHQSNHGERKSRPVRHCRRGADPDEGTFRWPASIAGQLVPQHE